MDDLALGGLIRAVRLRRGLSQADVANVAGVSQGLVSLMERGHCDALSLRALRRLAGALDIRIDLTGRWRGGDGARLLSRRHSALAESFAAFMVDRPGWSVEPEVSFAHYGERGIVDQLAWHPGRRHILIVELKTEFVDINEMLGTLDRKRRLVHQIAASRGWEPALVSVWLILSDTRTNRRHAADHRTLLRSRFRLDGRQLPAFLANPTEATTGLAFWTLNNPGSKSPNRKVGSGSRGVPATHRRSVSGQPSRLRAG